MNISAQTQRCMGCMSPLTGDTPICPACGFDNGHTQNRAHHLPIRSILAGKYLVGKALGQGGFGITYIGLDLLLQTKVAIKEYYPDTFCVRNQASAPYVAPRSRDFVPLFDAGQQTFLNEAQTIAGFSNQPGIVSVLGFFHENNTAYLIMEYVEGRTFSALLPHHGGKIRAEEALPLFRPMFETLARIHHSGLLHRDISPDNIIVQGDGSIKLIDFGAARQMSLEGERSNTINVKHGYAPEEQYRTHGKQGPWTDIYSLCATLYHITTGKRPPQSLERIINDQLVPPRALGATLTPLQEVALMKGLSVRGADRQQTVEELYKDLYMDDVRREPHAQAQAARAKKPGLRSRLPLIIGLMVGAVILTVWLLTRL